MWTASHVDAVLCVVEMEREMTERNADVPIARSPHLACSNGRRSQCSLGSCLPYGSGGLLKPPPSHCPPGGGAYFPVPSAFLAIRWRLFLPVRSGGCGGVSGSVAPRRRSSNRADD